MQQFFFETHVYKNRRTKLKKNLGSGKFLFLGNKESGINFRDNWYPFRQDSTFLYYFGVNIPGLYAIIDVDNDEEILFGDELTIDDIVWTGPLPSLHDLAARSGIAKVLPVSKLAGYLDQNTQHLPPYRPEHTLVISQYKGIQAGNVGETASIPFIKSVVAQRQIKSSEEIEQLHIAAHHTSEMHHRVMKSAEPGRYEYDLVAQAYKYAWSCNLPMSFPPISTINGHILHNHEYGHQLKSGDMVLFDGGMESSSGYAGDMTRTFPVDASFTSIQAEMYDIVHQSFKEAEAAVKPGIKFKDIHLLAAKVLVEGLKDLGIMKGDAEEAVKEGAHTMFFQCGLGHMMGMDVHDMENLGEPYVGYTDTYVKSKEFGLKSLRLGKKLQSGFVLTVEPGIYIIPELIDLRMSEGKYLDFINYKELNKHRHFGGIRIENDYLVTDTGYEVLGNPIPTSRKWVEETRRTVLE